MASKAVSKEQGLLFDGKLLQGEELFRLVKKVWDNCNNLPGLARAYVGHHSNRVFSIRTQLWKRLFE